MEDFNFRAARGEAVANLEEAAGIAGGDDGRAGGGDVVEFSPQKLAGHFGLDEVVNSGAAAAPHRFGKRHDVEARYVGEKFAGLGGDFLAVAEVAGVVIGDARFGGRFFGRAEADVDEPFADVLHFLGPLPGPGGIERIVVEEAVEMFEVRSAAGGVGDDGVERVEVELVEEAPGEIFRLFVFAVVGEERSATALRGRRNDRAAVGKKDVGGVAVDVAVDQILDAAGEEADVVGGRFLIASCALRAPGQ
jgi:hypothetical protein